MTSINTQKSVKIDRVELKFRVIRGQKKDLRTTSLGAVSGLRRDGNKASNKN
jgi:hypothetical protein